MDLETALTAYLLAQTGLTALIGRRFRFDELPQGEKLPAVVCQCISNIPIHTHQGQSKTGKPNYQFTIYASSRAGAWAVADQIRAALCDYRGDMKGLRVQRITLLNDIPSTETTSDGTIKVHTVDLEFQIIYNRE